jgi:hypothetical protein
LFHVLEHGASGTIASEEIRAAACIVGWHLNEARRLLAELDMPASLAAAIWLDAWLRSAGQRHRSRVGEADLLGMQNARSELRPGQP